MFTFISKELALYGITKKKEFQALLCYLPLLVLLIVISFSYNYSTVTTRTPVCINGQVLSQDTEEPCYNNSLLNMGEGNTNEGFRIENSLLEHRINTPESEQLKTMATRNGFKMHSKHFGYATFQMHSVIHASVNQQVFHHQFLI